MVRLPWLCFLFSVCALLFSPVLFSFLLTCCFPLIIAHSGLWQSMSACCMCFSSSCLSFSLVMMLAHSYHSIIMGEGRGRTADHGFPAPLRGCPSLRSARQMADDKGNLCVVSGKSGYLQLKMQLILGQEGSAIPRVPGKTLRLGQLKERSRSGCW